MFSSPRSGVRAFAAVFILSVALVLSGCQGTPSSAPNPTPSQFTSDEEAFTAAKATYSAHVAAFNNVDISDPATFEPMFAVSSGALLAADRESFNAMHRDGYVIFGKERIISFQGVNTEADYSVVTARACLDVSQVEIRDFAGVSQVNPQRPDVYPLRLTFVADERNTLLIDSAEVTEDEPCE